MARSILGDRVALSRQTLILVIGDVLMIALFVAAGQLRHGNPLLAGLDTFAAFAIGWTIVATPAGAYTNRALENPRYAGSLAVIGWTGGTLIGQLIRTLTGASTGFVPVFTAVALVTGGILLVGWRLSARIILT